MERRAQSVCPISDNEILIVGGEDKEGNYLHDAVIFNTETLSSKRVIDAADIGVPHMASGKM